MNSVGIQLLGEGSDSLVLRGLVSASLQTKPSPNKSTTPVLSARGPRRAALGSGPLGGWPNVLVVMSLAQ